MRVRRLIIEIRLEWSGNRNDKEAFAQMGWLEFLVVCMRVWMWMYGCK